jgi:D-alanyl-D-alanine carboxypeptidase (penicillin-binding protein 5/6)
VLESIKVGRLLTAAGVAVGLAGSTLALAGPAQAAAIPAQTATTHTKAAPAHTAVTTTAVHPATAAATGPGSLSAAYAEIEDAANGSELWGKSESTEIPMGSITKVMTAIVVIEAGNLNQLVTVPDGITAYDTKYEASTAGLVPGQQLTAEQLLYAMLVPSGCDAAYTLAQAYGPGTDAFIEKMNLTANLLGLKHTHFSDFSGLPDPTEYSTYSTASDLIQLGRDAMKLPLFATIVGTSTYHVDAVTGEHPAFTWNTTDPILGVYPGALGIKTGSTDAAGFCLLFEAVKNGEEVIGVVLDDPSSWSTVGTDATTLLNYGFSIFPGSTS